MTFVRRLNRPEVVDTALGVLFAAAVLLITHRIEDDGPDFRALDVLADATIVVAGLALSWRRRAPMAVLAATSLAVTVYVARDYSGGPIFLSPLIAMYTVASLNDRKRWILAVLNSTLAITVVGTLFAGTDNNAEWFKLVYVTWGFAAGFLGDASRSRREYLLSLEERARHLEETREEEARRRVAEERLHIARELHDVVAHSLSSINIQAGAGAHVSERHPEQAHDALLAIKEASKDALGELRATLGMLRSTDESAPRAPTPNLTLLDGLVRRTEEAGLTVEVQVEGAQRPLPPPVDAAAYRIVQESLTNVLRHAGPTRATVAIRYIPDRVEVEVTDEGIGMHMGATPGHGIAGMRERAALLGGTVEAGPRPSGGFRVHACLPAPAEVPS